jgi:hypothetical protein
MKTITRKKRAEITRAYIISNTLYTIKCAKLALMTTENGAIYHNNRYA